MAQITTKAEEAEYDWTVLIHGPTEASARVLERDLCSERGVKDDFDELIAITMGSVAMTEEYNECFVHEWHLISQYKPALRIWVSCNVLWII